MACEINSINSNRICPSLCLNNWGLCTGSRSELNDSLFVSPARKPRLRMSRTPLAMSAKRARLSKSRVHCVLTWYKKLNYSSNPLFCVCVSSLCSPHRLHCRDQDALRFCGHPVGQHPLPGHGQVQLWGRTVSGARQHHSVCGSAAGDLLTFLLKLWYSFRIACHWWNVSTVSPVFFISYSELLLQMLLGLFLPLLQCGFHVSACFVIIASLFLLDV